MLLNSGSFPASVLHAGWIPVNILGLLGCITLTLSIPYIHRERTAESSSPFSGSSEYSNASHSSRLSGADGSEARLHTGNQIYGTPGVLISQIGAILFAAIQYYETFLWPVAASMDSSMVAFDGPFVFGDLRVSIPLVLSGLILTVGFFLLMIESIRSGQKKTWPSLLFIGVLLFGMGMIVPVRTIGLMLMTAGLFHYGKAAAGKQIQD
ncbi:MAG TPA: hypothetical protein DEA96_17740 [Leptospiraceae bacterium]|nr:hypothetical protein [Spirochaetaceae bacterium]HBS06817.1 hypothetical protein [Leptospiraceae bacterium]|tara:strand:- start:8957 stop:9583 length:627 start_codon:yes stop_codon:yes gene_type:complete